MFRTFLSIAAMAALLCAPGAAQTQMKESATTKPRTQSSSKAGSAARPGAIVNLNTATATELESLPGIGAKTAARIIDYRQKKGPFKKIEELMNVQGVGEKSFLKMRAQLTVSGKPDGGAQ